MSKHNGQHNGQLILPMGQKGLIPWPEGYVKGLKGLVQYIRDKSSIVSPHTGRTIDYTIQYVGLDIETEGLSPYEKGSPIISCAVSPEPGISFPFVINHQGQCLSQEDFYILKVLLDKPEVRLIGHNIKFDLNWLAIKYNTVIKCQIFDTLFAEYLLDENNPEGNSLEVLTQKYLPEMGNFKSDVNRKSLAKAPTDDVLVYNAKDADASRRLFNVLYTKLNEQNLLPLASLGMDVIKTLHRIETRGIYLDYEWAKTEQRKLFEKAVEHRVNINKYAGYGVDPDKQNALKKLLFNNLTYERYDEQTDTFESVCFVPTRFTENQGISTDGETIQELMERIPVDQIGSDTYKCLETLLEYKECMKLLNSFYAPLKTKWIKSDGRVHSTYNLGTRRLQDSNGGTVTGRLSSSNPNLQQIPISSRVRGMLAGTPGYWFGDGDFSQLELRVAAYLSQETRMIDAFNQGHDIHTSVMSNIKGVDYTELESIVGNDSRGIPANKKHPGYADLKVERVGVKRINFGILYGITAPRLQRLLKLDLGVLWPIEKCEELIHQWLTTYSSINNWLYQTKLFAVNNKYVIMPMGQKRRLPDASFKTTEGRRALRQAINFPVQSLASWICLSGLTLLDNFFESMGCDAGIVLQVHDSVGFEIEKQYFELQSQVTIEDVTKTIQDIMENKTKDLLRTGFGINFNVPLSFPVSIGERWS